MTITPLLLAIFLQFVIFLLKNLAERKRLLTFAGEKFKITAKNNKQQYDKNSKFLVVAQLKIPKIVRG